VRRVLRLKFELGLFERPLVEVDAAAAASETPAQRALARRIARRSLVLLRNDGTLPLAPGLRSVAVIGPNADAARHLLGDYTYPAHVESLLEMQQSGRNVFSMPIADGVTLDGGVAAGPTVLGALRARLGAAVRFARGCDIVGSSTDGLAEAVALAAEADVAVLVLGDKAGLTDDCTSGESRDRASLDLPGVQEELARAVLATGTPVVLVLVCGRPCGSAWLHERCAAALIAWLPGPEGAEAIAEALCGEVAPGGKLPITYPRSVGQVPTYYGHKVSGGRSHWKGDYVDSPAAPLYPFGHGLGYTTFALDDPVVHRREVHWNEAVEVDVTVRNTGARAGDEVVQLYVCDPQASVTRPVLELKGFLRVGLAAGTSRRLRFRVPVGQVGFYDGELRWVVEPGQLELLVGTSARELVPAGSVTVAADPSGRPPLKAFDGSASVLG
jgi:beta-glucosidase